MSRRRHRRRSVSAVPSRARMRLIGLAVVLVAGGAVWFGISASSGVPFAGYYHVVVQATQAENVLAHTPVHINGVKAGQVERVERRGGVARIRLQLADAHRPLRSDTRVRIVPRAPLSEFSIDLRPGPRGKPVPSGGAIALGQTTTAVPLDTVLSTLDGPRRKAMGITLKALGAGVAGQGASVNAALADAPAYVRNITAVARSLNERAPDVRELVTESAGAATALDAVRRELAASWRPGATVMRTFARRRDDVRGALRAAPPALATATRRLPVVDKALVRLERTATTAADVLEPAPSGLRALAAALRSTAEPVRGLRPTLRSAGEATGPALKLLRTADPLLEPVDRALTLPLRTIRELGPRRCDIAEFFAAWRGFLKAGYRIGSGPLGTLTRLRFTPSVGGMSVPDAPVRSEGVHRNEYPGPCQAMKDGT